MDAMLGNDPKRAAQVVQDLRKEYGATLGATPGFSKAVREASDEERQKLFALLEGRDVYSLPAFYELRRHASDQRVWFKALEAMTKPGYKGLQVVWRLGDKKPRKAKSTSLQNIDISQGSYKRVDPLSLPPEVLERFDER